MLRVGAIVALMAIVFRAVIPMGYMATANAETGTIEVAVCTGGHGQEIRLIEMPGEKQPKPAQDEPCPFAMVAVAPPPAVTDLATASIVYAFEYARAPLPVAFTPDAWGLHAPPTGPPTQA